MRSFARLLSCNPCARNRREVFAQRRLSWNELLAVKGFSKRNINAMLALCREYPDPSAIVQQPVAQFTRQPLFAAIYGNTRSNGETGGIWSNSTRRLLDAEHLAQGRISISMSGNPNNRASLVEKRPQFPRIAAAR
jgi:hypothetical protein